MDVKYTQPPRREEGTSYGLSPKIGPSTGSNSETTPSEDNTTQ